MLNLHHGWRNRASRFADAQAVARASEALRWAAGWPLIHAPKPALRAVSAPWMAVRRGYALLYVSLLMMAMGALVGAVHLALAMIVPGEVSPAILAVPATVMWWTAQIGYAVGAMLCARIPASTGIRIPALVTAIGAAITLVLAICAGPMVAFGAAAATNFACFVTMLGIAQITHAGVLERRAVQLLQLNVTMILAAGGIFGVSYFLRRTYTDLGTDNEFIFCGLLFLAYFFLVQSQGAWVAGSIVDRRINATPQRGAAC